MMTLAAYIRGHFFLFPLILSGTVAKASGTFTVVTIYSLEILDFLVSKLLKKKERIYLFICLFFHNLIKNGRKNGD